MRLAQLLGRPRRREPQFRWRVQLYCGHIAELTRPEDTARPDLEIRGETCPECHRRPSVIVAYELVGLDDGQPDARQVPAPQNPGVSRD
ncbi:hypothetical protein LO772_08040 [Yinghuangia sp. ASG 101]|uniref:hypothetical protein n=1 Tax=Yinghuangia sp. ASG 101 TaxID=2896848 RepID=UPI001E541DA7|nr:hypothetical protein [Yinghuangia sp. ASG 101]UGQ13544.1 hypothetical protein LO772_08040 [Yinghuangia sp. ASG 101]